jgi:hypothetical protein
MKTFKLTKSEMILRARDGAFIPPDPGNRDYQEYMTWLAAGNTPDPADTESPIVSTPTLNDRLAALEMVSERDAVYDKIVARGQKGKFTREQIDLLVKCGWLTEEEGQRISDL